MNKVAEPRIEWGGNWTKTKLEAFEDYVNAYLCIMNAQKIKYNGWPVTIYFDGFAGSGTRIYPEKETDNMIKNFFFNQEFEVYRGSAERVLRLSQKFDYYYFIDKDRSSIDALKQLLREKNLAHNNCYFICDDVNNQLIKFSKFLNQNQAALVFLDPFGMQINWSSIEILKGKRVDLWILIPSGVIINRFLDKRGELKYIDKLEKFLGLEESEIRNRFYEIKNIQTLFGVENITFKINDSINRIGKLYAERLNQIFRFVVDKPLILYNSKNVPIYHFVFASNNKTAIRIAKYLIEKKTK